MSRLLLVALTIFWLRGIKRHGILIVKKAVIRSLGPNRPSQPESSQEFRRVTNSPRRSWFHAFSICERI